MECTFTKKYEKVDSFLKRFLPQSRYSCVRLIEPCVAVSNVYNKQFKFAVLADDWLYVTENPPKVAKDIQEVARIVDITSVELINDVPEFLGGDLKYRTHHILLTYKKSGPDTDLQAQLTPNSSPSLLTRSLQENDLRNSRQKSNSLGNVSQNVSAARKDKLSKSLQENDLKNSKLRSTGNTLEEKAYPKSGPSNALKKSSFSRSLQENDLRNSRRISSSNEWTQKSNAMSPMLPPRKNRVTIKTGRDSIEEDFWYEKDSSLADSGTSGSNQAQQNRQLPTVKIVQEKNRRKSSPGALSKEDSALNESSDFVRRSNHDRLSKNSREKSRRRSGAVTFDDSDFENADSLSSSNDASLAKLSQNSLSPELVTRALTGQDKTRRVPLMKFSSINSEDGLFEHHPIPLHHSFTTINDFKSKNSHPVRLTASASAVDLRAMQVKFEPILNSGSETNLTSTPKSGFISWLKERRGPKSGDKSAGVGKSSDGSSSDFDDSFTEEVFSEIHLYMILDDTVMLAYLRSIWDNCLLNSSLKFSKKEKSPKPVVKNKRNSSLVTALFDQMEKEILSSEDFQAAVELVHELHTACQKDVLVKKLFWQSPDLFAFLVKEICQFIKETPDEEMKRNRADELEFILLLFECLTEMFRETELLASRMNRLKAKKLSLVRDLILASTTCPELSKNSSSIETPDISEAAETLLAGQRRKKKEKKEKSSHDIELESLWSELIKHQVSLLHELFIIAYQAVWFPSDDKTLNISWMMKILESSTTIKRYLQEFVQQVMRFISKADDSCLTSDDTTLLYRLLSVLKTILQQSLELRRHIHEFYTEEFRYYIKPHVISSSLSQACPLTPSTLKLVDDVIDLVTEAPLKNRCPVR